MLAASVPRKVRGDVLWNAIDVQRGEGARLPGRRGAARDAHDEGVVPSLGPQLGTRPRAEALSGRLVDDDPALDACSRQDQPLCGEEPVAVFPL